MNRIVAYVIIFLLPLLALADDVKTVTGEASLIVDENLSLRECKHQVAEKARENAIARAFNANVAVNTIQQESTNGLFFDQVSNSGVRGEWIADIGEPEYKVTFNAAGEQVVWCKVKGKARALTNETVEFTAYPMRNGSDPRYKSEEFRSGDFLTVAFKAPMDGYVAIFLVDDGETAYTMLPYLSNTSGQVKVKGNREYVFFDPDKADKSILDEVDQMYLTTEKDAERDQLMVVFSPNPFSRPNDSHQGDYIPRTLSRSAFHKWLMNRESNDKRMSVQTFNLVIKK